MPTIHPPDPNQPFDMPTHTTGAPTVRVERESDAAARIQALEETLREERERRRELVQALYTAVAYLRDAIAYVPAERKPAFRLLASHTQIVASLNLVPLEPVDPTSTPAEKPLDEV